MLLYGKRHFRWNEALWLAANRSGFSRIPHGQYAIFIARNPKKTTKWNQSHNEIKKIENEWRRTFWTIQKTNTENTTQVFISFY